MKWKNRGHEFDEFYGEIASKQEIYLFGAGDYGALFLPLITKEFNVIGFIDNNKEKQETGYLGYPVFLLEHVLPLQEQQAIVLTISQFARASAQKQLVLAGVLKNKQYFLFEEFWSVYQVYKYDRVYMTSISFLPSTICNLKCRHCLNFNPFAKKFYMRDFDELTKDLDLFFEKVDRIMIFHLSGGEPMLFSRIGELIRYIDQKYGDRIDAFRTVTNGTIMPSKEVLEALAESNVEVTVDDYRDAVPQFAEVFDELLVAFDKYHVRYVVNKADAWVDLAPECTDYSDKNDLWMQRHFENCCQTWHELRGGKLYSCNYAAYAVVAGIAGEEDEEETFDLGSVTVDNCKELVEFRLGYTTKGYTNFCKTCRGFNSENTEEVKPAVQDTGVVKEKVEHE